MGIDGVKTVEQFSHVEQCFYLDYCKSDINGAFKALKQYLDIVIDYKKAGVGGLDYNYIFVSIYSRLYLIEKKRGLNDKAELYLNKAYEYHSKEMRIPESRIDNEKDKMINFFLGIDKVNDVKWLKGNN